MCRERRRRSRPPSGARNSKVFRGCQAFCGSPRELTSSIFFARFVTRRKYLKSGSSPGSFPPHLTPCKGRTPRFRLRRPHPRPVGRHLRRAPSLPPRTFQLGPERGVFAGRPHRRFGLLRPHPRPVGRRPLPQPDQVSEVEGGRRCKKMFRISSFTPPSGAGWITIAPPRRGCTPPPPLARWISSGSRIGSRRGRR